MPTSAGVYHWLAVSDSLHKERQSQLTRGSNLYHLSGDPPKVSFIKLVCLGRVRQPDWMVLWSQLHARIGHTGFLHRYDR